MKRKKWLLGSILTMAIVMSLSVPALANNQESRSSSDSTFPSPFIGYAITSGYKTGLREKENDSYHYIKNTSGFNLWVISEGYPGYKNVTNGGHAIVPNGEYFITNFVSEKGYSKCRLNITTASSGTSGYLTGAWSPDSVGSYPVVN